MSNREWLGNWVFYSMIFTTLLSIGLGVAYGLRYGPVFGIVGGAAFWALSSLFLVGGVVESARAECKSREEKL